MLDHTLLSPAQSRPFPAMHRLPHCHPCLSALRDTVRCFTTTLRSSISTEATPSRLSHTAADVPTNAPHITFCIRKRSAVVRVREATVRLSNMNVLRTIANVGEKNRQRSTLRQVKASIWVGQSSSPPERFLTKATRGHGLIEYDHTAQKATSESLLQFGN
jgi:hypothetical protein